MTTAQAIRTLVREGLDGDEEDQPPRSGASPITISGVFALAVAPALLAAGYTTIGGAIGVFAAVYLLLWATAYDIVLQEHVGNARQKLRRAGGLVGFFQLMRSDHPVEDPSTPVERAARLDRWGLVSAGVIVILLLPFAAFYYMGHLELVFSLLPTWSIWSVIITVGILAHAVIFLLGISTIATVAITTARGSAADDEAAAETLGDS
jgi:protein-S-isoprenylcysteine O-methyltransferase Ste14